MLESSDDRTDDCFHCYARLENLNYRRSVINFIQSESTYQYAET